MVRRDLTLLPWSWESSEKSRGKGSQLACDLRGKTWLRLEMVSASHQWWWYKIQQTHLWMWGWKVCLDLTRRRSSCWPAVFLEPPADQCLQAQPGGNKVLGRFGWDEMKDSVAEMKDEVSQERRRNVLWWKTMGRLPVAAPCFWSFLLVLRSIKHWLLTLSNADLALFEGKHNQYKAGSTEQITCAHQHGRTAV